MKKPTKAASERAAKIAATVSLLEPYRGQAAAVWEHLPGAWEASFGAPLDMADPHSVMLCEVVFNQLVKLE